MAERERSVAVIGGGVAGLAAARHLLDRGGDALRVVVFEADAEPGGHLRTIEDEGWRLEWGPNGFLDNEPATLRLVERLGLGDELLRSTDAARRRFLLHRGRLSMLPASPPAFLKTDLLSWKAKLRVAREIFVKPRDFSVDPADDPTRDESIYDFGVRRLGRDFAEAFLDPMVKGVFGGDARELSLAASFPRMVELEREHGGLFKALIAVSKRKKKTADAGPSGTLHSFRGGMAALTGALAASLRDDERTDLRCDAPVASLRRDGDEWLVETTAATFGSFDAVIDAAPAHAAAGYAPTARLRELVARIPYVPMAVITLAFDRDRVGHDVDGFGHLVPTYEGRRLLGALWTSSIFADRAPEGTVLLRCMAGGPRDPHILDESDGDLIAMACGELRGLLDLRGDPRRAWAFRHPRAIAQYVPGHLALLKTVERELDDLPGYVPTGSSYRGISVNYCAKDAEAAAGRVLRGLGLADARED